MIETKPKKFDAVAESRKWRENTARKLDAMSLDERLVYLESFRARDGKAEPQSRSRHIGATVRLEPINSIL